MNLYEVVVDTDVGWYQWLADVYNIAVTFWGSDFSIMLKKFVQKTDPSFTYYNISVDKRIKTVVNNKIPSMSTRKCAYWVSSWHIPSRKILLTRITSVFQTNKIPKINFQCRYTNEYNISMFVTKYYIHNIVPQSWDLISSLIYLPM